MVNIMSKTHYIIPVFVPDLGCPHQCVFCNQKEITGLNTVPGPDQVAGIIREHLRTIKRNPETTIEVAFYGGSFTAVDQSLQKELLSQAYKFVINGLIDTIRVSTRPDAISDEIMELLSSYGVSTVELGVQSMDDEVLHKSGRGHTSRDVLRAAAFIKSWGMDLGFQLMVGLPGDTEQKAIASAVTLISLQPDLVRIYPCLVLKHTPLADLYISTEYKPLSLDEAVQRCKRLLLMFEKAGITVIRIGLQPSEQINLQGDVLAGPYHPAFRELVETAVCRDQLDYLLNRLGIKSADMIQVGVSPAEVSQVRGHRAGNVGYLRDKYGIRQFLTDPDPLITNGTIRLLKIDHYRYDLAVNRLELPVS